MSTKSHYEILDIETTASEREIKESYRIHAAAWHPDRHAGQTKQRAENKMKAINEAYRVLGNTQAKAEYDRRCFNGNFETSSKVEPHYQSTGKLPKGYENESTYAQQLVLTQPQSWTYLIIAEMLGNRCERVRSKYESLSNGEKELQIQQMDGRSYLTFATEVISRFDSMFQTIVDAFLTGSNSVNSAMERNDTVVGPRKVLRAVNKAENAYVLLLNWELEVASLEPPNEYLHLKRMITGLTEPTFDTLCEFSDDLNRMNQRASFANHYTLSMELESPENMGNIQAEIKRLKLKLAYPSLPAEEQQSTEGRKGRRIDSFEELIELWPAVLKRMEKRISAEAANLLAEARPADFSEREVVLEFEEHTAFEEAMEAIEYLPFEDVLNQCLLTHHYLSFRLADRRQIMSYFEL